MTTQPAITRSALTTHATQDGSTSLCGDDITALDPGSLEVTCRGCLWHLERDTPPVAQWRLGPACVSGRCDCEYTDHRDA